MNVLERVVRCLLEFEGNLKSDTHADSGLQFMT